MAAVGKIDEVEIWKKERLARLREQIDTEAAKRVTAHRAKAGAAVLRMHGRRGRLTTITAQTEAGIGEVCAMLRHAPKANNGRSPTVHMRQASEVLNPSGIALISVAEWPAHTTTAACAGTKRYRLTLPPRMARNGKRVRRGYDYSIHMCDTSCLEREFIEWGDPRIGCQRDAELC